MSGNGRRVRPKPQFVHARARLVALSRPSRPVSTSKVTFWLSARPVRPARSTAEMWTNTSLPPPSGAMKPKPLVVLNHFTVPVAMCPELLLYAARGSAAARLVVVQDRVTEPIEGQVVDSRNVSECNMGPGGGKRKGYRAVRAISQHRHHGAC